MAFNTSRAISGAGTGAVYGAQVGGPWGAAIGGTIGGVAGGFFGGDDNAKPNQVSTFDPNQRQLYDQSTQALQGGGGPLADVYGQFDPAAMKDYYQRAYAQPQYQEFQNNIVPSITGAFRGKNLQNSSYLGGHLAQAGTNVQNNLNSQMSRMIYEGQQSSLNRRSSALDRILQMSTHVNNTPQSSIFDSLLSTLGNKAIEMGGDWLGKEGKGGAQDYFSNLLSSKTPALPTPAAATPAAVTSAAGG